MTQLHILNTVFVRGCVCVGAYVCMCVWVRVCMCPSLFQVTGEHLSDGCVITECVLMSSVVRPPWLCALGYQLLLLASALPPATGTTPDL